MDIFHPIALFRLTVLGPLASREQFEHGELSRIIRELARQRYNIPDSNRVYLSEKTIEHWYRRYKQGGIDALTPKVRDDRGHSKIAQSVQQAIIQCKNDNPRRSLNTIIKLLEDAGLVAQGELKRSTVHRLLQQRGLSRPAEATEVVERRSYNALYAGDLWCSDVMHGPEFEIDGVMRKVYLVSIMDDASRLLPHSAFCLSETALDIEGVLKQALLKRGLPVKLIVDNGSAYRSKSLQGICIRLGIRLIHCRPYDPESKGKLERWHSTFRKQFLDELDKQKIHTLEDLNSRLWAWINQHYHNRPHCALDGMTPLQRYQQDLHRIEPLGKFANCLDELFYHRLKRKVRKDGSISYEGRFYEVPCEQSGHSVLLVVDPHTQTPLFIEDGDGKRLGQVTPQDKQANNDRKRIRPSESAPQPTQQAKQFNAVEMALHKQNTKLAVPLPPKVPSPKEK